MAEEPQEDKNKFKAPPEDLAAVERHFRPAEPEEIAAAEKYSQRIQRLIGAANFGARLTVEELELTVAIQQEQGYRDHNDSHGLAHVLIIQGRYQEAYQACPDRAVECLALIAARDRADDARCNCIGEKIESKEAPTLHPIKRLWIPEREAFNWLVRCNQCGELNIVEAMPLDVQEYHGYRLEKMKRAQ